MVVVYMVNKYANFFTRQCGFTAARYTIILYNPNILIKKSHFLEILTKNTKYLPPQFAYDLLLLFAQMHRPSAAIPRPRCPQSRLLIVTTPAVEF